MIKQLMLLVLTSLFLVSLVSAQFDEPVYVNGQWYNSLLAVNKDDLFPEGNIKSPVGLYVIGTVVLIISGVFMFVKRSKNEK